jgi:corrinoid protein of di/trimethylamine methyltransferase
MTQEILLEITQAVLLGEPEDTVRLTQDALSANLEPMTIIQQGLVPGMNLVGEKYATGEYFLPDLIIAAGCMQDAMQSLEPELLKRQQVVESAGIVVLGTVKGDIHAIGKSLVGTLLSANGFKVYDLGVDVNSDAFIEKIKETNAQIIGLSALLTTTMVRQREIVQMLEEAGIRAQVKVLVGGAPVTKSWADEIGADGFAEDAMGAVRVARELVKS